MRVKDLIKRLEKHDGNLEVVINASSVLLEDATEVEVAGNDSKSYLIIHGEFEDEE